MKSQVTITFDLQVAGRWLLGLLFLWAAVSKLANLTEFLGSVYAYQLPLPRPLLQFAAVVLPWFELLCGLLLLFNVWTESALVAACALLVIFLIATGQAWVRGLKISCGCFNLKVFGLDKNFPGLIGFVESPAFAFLRNLLLTGLSVFLLKKRVEETTSAVTPSSSVNSLPRSVSAKGK